MVENTPYFQGKLDYSEGKEYAPAYYKPSEKAEWMHGWVEAQHEADQKTAETGKYVIFDATYDNTWENAAPKEDFTTVAQAERYCEDNDLIDVAIFKFEKFV